MVRMKHRSAWATGVQQGADIVRCCMVLMTVSRAAGRGLLVVVATFALQACGGSSNPQRGIRADLATFHGALVHRNAKVACTDVTSRYWQALREQLVSEIAGSGGRSLPGPSCRADLAYLFRLGGSMSSVANFRVSNITVHGSTATAVSGSTASAPPGHAEFIEESDGHWRLDCCTGSQLDRLASVTFRIPSGSMLPTIKVGQTVISDNAAMRAHPPTLGEIIVFHPPLYYDLGCANPREGQAGGPGQAPCGVARAEESNSQWFIKRVVGLPGDRIAIKSGHVYRDGAKENDPYISPCPGQAPCTFPVQITVPPGDYYVLGDNRGESDDSRFWGPIKRSWIVGLVRP